VEITWRGLLQGCSNGSNGGFARDPEGGPESRLWAAVVERGQEARTARPDEERYAFDSPHPTRRREVTSGDDPHSALLRSDASDVRECIDGPAVWALPQFERSR
jgi:hypothetical protein